MTPSRGFLQDTLHEIRQEGQQKTTKEGRPVADIRTGSLGNGGQSQK